MSAPSVQTVRISQDKALLRLWNNRNILIANWQHLLQEQSMLKWDEGGECVWNPHEVLLLWSTGEPFLLAAVHHQENGRRARHSAESEDSPEGTPSYHRASEDSSPGPTLPNLVHSRVGHLLDPLARNTQERGCGECGFWCIRFCDCCNKSHKLNGLKCALLPLQFIGLEDWSGIHWADIQVLAEISSL